MNREVYEHNVWVKSMCPACELESKEIHSEKPITTHELKELLESIAEADIVIGADIYDHPCSCAVREIETLTKEHDELQAQLAKSQSDIQWMVKRAADNSLDGYRELADRCISLETKNDNFQAQLARCVEIFNDLKALGFLAHSLDESVDVRGMRIKAMAAIEQLPKTAHLDAEILRAAEEWVSNIGDSYTNVLVVDSNLIKAVIAKQEATNGT